MSTEKAGLRVIHTRYRYVQTSMSEGDLSISFFNSFSSHTIYYKKACFGNIFFAIFENL